MINPATWEFFEFKAEKTGNRRIFDNLPELYPDVIKYWEAFWILNGDRQSGFSIGYIPTTAIRNYFEDFGYDRTERLKALKYLRAMDLVYVNFYNDKQEQERAQNGNN